MELHSHTEDEFLELASEILELFKPTTIEELMRVRDECEAIWLNQPVKVRTRSSAGHPSDELIYVGACFEVHFFDMGLFEKVLDKAFTFDVTDFSDSDLRRLLKVVSCSDDIKAGLLKNLHLGVGPVCWGKLDCSGFFDVRSYKHEIITLCEFQAMMARKMAQLM